ncbi:MAG: hypothetical protein MJ123_08260, partial [Lachnospiraceae bacterium]|nr:hypothetical protein [Lachnospiraceae bacterium]
KKDLLFYNEYEQFYRFAEASEAFKEFCNVHSTILNLHALRYILDVMVNYATIFNRIHILMLALLGRSEVLYFL